MSLTLKTEMKTEMKTCETCETEMDHWWDDEEGLPFCSSCFKEEGGQCDGCHWDDCVLCNEEDEECPGCLRSKEDEEYREARCCRCDTEMCGQCYSVSPIEGDDECYCKRCAQDRLDEEEEKGKKMCEFCEEYGDTPRLATIRRCIGGWVTGNAYDHLCEVCDKRGDEEMKEWAKAETKVMKLNPDLGFDHEGYWILNPYVSQCGWRDGEYGKTHEELLTIFKTQEYLDWLRASGEFAVE